MVFIHAGDFVVGWGGFAGHDGTNLATATGNIVINFEYRLGPFGFLSNPELRAEDPHGSAGDYGILDQIAALQWVHDNIAAFGGDPTNVTIFGEDSSSLFVHLTSPLSRGLFSRAIVQSVKVPFQGGQAASLQPPAADAVGATVATNLGCSNAGTLLDCLRGASEALVLAAGTFTDNIPTTFGSWAPVVDGYAIPTEPTQAIASGSFARVPILIGNDRNDGTLTMVAPSNDAVYLSDCEAMSPGNGAAIAAQYPIASYADSFDAASAMLTDGWFVCPTRRAARAIAASGTPIFRYDFTYVFPECTPDLGAFATSEMPFVLGNPFSVGDCNVVSFDPSEVALSQTIMGYWGTMASTGNPNGGGRLSWPAYQLPAEPQIVLDLTASTESQYEKANCDFWDSLGPGGATDAGAQDAPSE
jgi:para-nitrobenzyl esterase